MSVQPVKRAAFQLHLSTAVILMLVTGGLMWLNLTPRTQHFTSPFLGNRTAYGPPLPVIVTWTDVDPPSAAPEPEFHIRFFGMDLTFAVLILFIIWYVREGLPRNLPEARPMRGRRL